MKDDVVTRLLRGMYLAGQTPQGQRCHALMDRWLAGDYSSWIFVRVLRPYRTQLEDAYTPP